MKYILNNVHQVSGQATNTTGQLLSQGNGTYLIQQSVVDNDPTTHTLITAAARASPQTDSAVRQYNIYIYF